MINLLHELIEKLGSLLCRITLLYYRDLCTIFPATLLNYSKFKHFNLIQTAALTQSVGVKIWCSNPRRGRLKS